MATLPDADGYEKNEMELKPDTVLLKPDTVQLEPDTVEQKPDTLELSLTGEQQAGKLQKVLADLRVLTLLIPEQVSKRLVEVIKETSVQLRHHPLIWEEPQWWCILSRPMQQNHSDTNCDRFLLHNASTSSRR